MKWAAVVFWDWARVDLVAGVENVDIDVDVVPGLMRRIMAWFSTTSALLYDVERKYELDVEGVSSDVETVPTLIPNRSR